MALETVVFSQDPFGYGFKDFYSLLGGPGGANWGYDFCLQQQQEDQESLEEDKSLIGIFDNRIMDRTVHANWDYSSSPPSVPHNINNELGIMSDPNSSPEACTVDQSYSPPVSAVAAVAEQAPSTATVGRRKRRRTRSSKNKEELENQRMTHIAVERNRRKQMNEYLAILRSLMPPSYVQRVSLKDLYSSFHFFSLKKKKMDELREKSKSTTSAIQDLILKNVIYRVTKRQ